MMASERIKRREPCSHEDCGSRRFHVGGDGYTYCDQGHQQSELGTIIAEDTGELIKRGRTSRRHESDNESIVSRVSGFRGSRQFEHYLVCLQLVLRKQLRWLIDVQKLPQELEGLVRDIWALRLRKLHGRVSASYDSETDTETRSGKVFSSQSESDGTETVTSRRSRSQIRTLSRTPTLIELLSLNHVGMLLLRLPVTVSDLLHMVNSADLLYYRAGREVPLSMRERLSGTYQEMFEPQALIAPDTIHRTPFDVFSMLNADFGMAVPPLNHPLILYRWLKELTLPLEVYVATQRLARELKADFSYAANAQTGTHKILRYPEVRLAVLMVIATKLLFPFDDTERNPKAGSDLSALRMDWRAWTAAQPEEEAKSHTGQAEAKPLSFEQAFRMTEADSLKLADDRLDEYLDWCEHNIASEDVRERGRAGREAEFRKTLFRMFPTRHSHTEKGHSLEGEEEKEEEEAPHDTWTSQLPLHERLLRVQAALRPKRIVAEVESANVARAGSSYVQYRDPIELDWPVDVFHRRVAAIAGISYYGMIRAVFFMEGKLHNHELNRRRRDQEGSQT